MGYCSNCGLQLADDSLICFRCGWRRPLGSRLRVVSFPPHDKIKSLIKWAAIVVAGVFLALSIIVVVSVRPTGKPATTERPQLVEAAAFAGPEIDGIAYRDREIVSTPVVVKANRDYSFDEFKEAVALEVRHYAVVNDSRDYELKWLYFTGEVVETRDTTTQEVMGELATKYKFPSKIMHWAMIRVEPQREILVAWADDSEFQDDLRVGDDVELMAFHQWVRDGVPQMALDYGKVRFLDR